MVGGEGLRQQPYYCDILPFFLGGGWGVGLEENKKKVLWILIYFISFPQKVCNDKNEMKPPLRRVLFEKTLKKKKKNPVAS